jgi:hypothetical protein
LKEVVVKDGLEKVGYRAFEGCSSLGQIVLPPSMREIGEEPFTGCFALNPLSVDGLKTISPDRARWGVPDSVIDEDSDDGYDGEDDDDDGYGHDGDDA